MHFRAKNTLKNNYYHILKHPLKRVWIKNAVKCCLFYHKRPRSRIHKGDKRVYTNLSLPYLLYLLYALQSTSLPEMCLKGQCYLNTKKGNINLLMEWYRLYVFMYTHTHTHTDACWLVWPHGKHITENNILIN
jgi:hypothetical protein